MKDRIIKFLINNWLTICLAFIPPILIWFYTQREKKSLSVSLENNLPIVSIDQDYLNDIKVFYKTKEVKSLRYLEFSIENKGNKPIQTSDFEIPLIFSFRAREITDPVVTFVNPKSLNPKLLKDTSTLIEIEPLLLNPKDKFSFKTILLDDADQVIKYDVRSRIIGIKDIEISDSTQKSDIDYLGIIAGIVGVIISLVSFYYLIKRIKFITFELPSGISASIKFGLEKDEIPAQKITNLANQLSISKYDTKANFIFLRLKIENLLADIVRKFDYEAPSNYSITRLAKLLYDKGHLDKIKLNSILNLAIIMNQEMHSIESYMTEDETSKIQDAALTTIAFLDNINETKQKKMVKA